ncbi:MAG: hypothetical protein ABJF11_16665 [Reichenbachiella sp.]|uniref:hypothetical protein n=1 Tax=Reichenbachiella sp. TaxID=2184521 RepID=UPI0032673518
MTKKLLFVVYILIVGCTPDDISRSYEESHANRLLSKDDTKTWSLVSRIENGNIVTSSCIDNNTLTFVEATDADSLYILGRSSDCVASDEIDTLYKANYTLDVDDLDVFQQTITLSEEKHSGIGSFTVEHLTSGNLQLRYREGRVRVEEQYSY